jgi:ABC-type dipeptide/oligopeptide/nickel transport system permease subunit
LQACYYPPDSALMALMRASVRNVVIVLAINLVGDGLRDTLNVR